VTAGRVPPMLSVYADGRVLSPSWKADGGFALPFVVRRLTSAGLAEMRSRLEGSGFFAGDIEIPPTTEVNSGFTTYVVSLRRGDRLVTARTTNFAMSTKGRALVDLAERWVRPERELPADAWMSGPAAYEAARWYVALSLNPAGVSSTDVDSTALESVIGNLASFGQQVRSSEAGTDRCASVDADVVARIVAAYAARGIELGPGDGEYFADLPWSGGRGSVRGVPRRPARMPAGRRALRRRRTSRHRGSGDGRPAYRISSRVVGVRARLSAARVDWRIAGSHAYVPGVTTRAR
jgi:hypothetical protein